MALQLPWVGIIVRLQAQACEQLQVSSNCPLNPHLLAMIHVPQIDYVSVLRLEGSSSKSALRGRRCSAVRISVGGATSRRVARSSHPPSLRTRAASLPSDPNTSFTRRNLDPSGARPPSIRVTRSDSSSVTSRKYSISSRRTTGPTRRLANSDAWKPHCPKKLMRESTHLLE